MTNISVAREKEMLTWEKVGNDQYEEKFYKKEEKNGNAEWVLYHRVQYLKEQMVKEFAEQLISRCGFQYVA